MRKVVGISGMVILTSLLCLLWFKNSRTEAPRSVGNAIEIETQVKGAGAAASRPQITSLPVGARKKMPEGDRQEYLEQLGYLPDDADDDDCRLIIKTSWWGKPVDPKKFWEGRPIWLDQSAFKAAPKIGRSYPPMPYDDPVVPKAPNDEKDFGGNADSQNRYLIFHSTQREGRFWDRFFKTHPKPPEELLRYQLEFAHMILQSKADFEFRGNPLNKTTQDIQESAQRLREGEPIVMGYPQEALRDDALLWTYILAERDDYQKNYAERAVSQPGSGRPFFARLAVNTNYILQPLTESQLQESIQWKIDYLRRLHQEKIDESYINAYLRAWNLKTDEVFR
jgi:hypothetical protein